MASRHRAARRGGRILGGERPRLAEIDGPFLAGSIPAAGFAGAVVYRVRGLPDDLVEDDFGDDEQLGLADTIDEAFGEIRMHPFFDDEDELAQAA